jgi:hypothetical protein
MVNQAFFAPFKTPPDIGPGDQIMRERTQYVENTGVEGYGFKK